MSNCAKALGVNTSTFSALMDNRTPEFLLRLRGVGLDIPIQDEEVDLKNAYSHNSGTVVNGELNKETLKILRDVIAEQREMLKYMRETLQEKDSIIEDLRRRLDGKHL